jgi:hypothetical protein
MTAAYPKKTGLESPDIVFIKSHWDYSPHIDEPNRDHCHIIRMKEQNLLLDFLNRKLEGALLISGRRGVGKTSTVFSTINEANKQQNATALLQY